MDALHYLNVAIGFSLTMTILATIVGTTTSLCLSAIRSRYRSLKSGVSLLLQSWSPQLQGEALEHIAISLLGSRIWNAWSPFRFLGFGTTEAIGREEMVLMLLRHAELPADGETLAATAANAWKIVGATVKDLTGKAPADLLVELETAILRFEADIPAAPSAVARTKALAEVAPKLAGRLFAQFDDVMTRTDDNDAISTHGVASVFALILLAVYPVDTVAILQRLTVSKATAAAAAELAVKTSLPAANLDDAAKDKAAKEVLNKLNDQGIFGDTFTQTDLSAMLDPSAFYTKAVTSLRTPGVWGTWFLIGLGAPFWQGLLEKLVGLRSKITAKTEDDRDRRSAQN